MNRPIKFRAKGKSDDQWHYGSLLQIGDDFSIATDTEAVYEMYDVAPSTLGQFTGLLDCNGKEIYEGDTIEVISRNRVQTVRIEWDNTMCGFCAYNVDKSANRPLGWFTQNATSIRIVAVPATLPNLSKN